MRIPVTEFPGHNAEENDAPGRHKGILGFLPPEGLHRQTLGLLETRGGQFHRG